MTIKTVRFLDGTFKLRGKEVDMTNQVLPIVQEYKVGVRGGYVSVDGKSVPGFPDRAIKVYVEGPDSIETVNQEGPAVTDDETDDEVMERMSERFMMLKEMTKEEKRGEVSEKKVRGKKEEEKKKEKKEKKERKR